jgi:predicted nucleotidyltransferase
MMQQQFAQKAAAILKNNNQVIGLAVGGSWLSKEMDEFSDLDLIVVTKNTISNNKQLMLEYAQSMGELLTGFTGEHVGEPRLLICLYQNPLLHVDIKFLTLDECHQRVETPHILLDTNYQLKNVFEQSTPQFPYPNYQWIEDRFWVWAHYALAKIGRGELVEAFDFLGFLRMVVLGPLLHIKNGHLPKGVRKVETLLPTADFELLQATLPNYSKHSLLQSLQQAVRLYCTLRVELFTPTIKIDEQTEKAVMDYFTKIEAATSV